jgi:hypothetical protein
MGISGSSRFCDRVTGVALSSLGLTPQILNLLRNRNHTPDLLPPSCKAQRRFFEVGNHGLLRG